MPFAWKPGMAAIAENIGLDIADHAAVVAFCRQGHIDLVMVGPEAPLVDRIADSLREAHIRVVGLGAIVARLEDQRGLPKICALALPFRPGFMAGLTMQRKQKPISMPVVHRLLSRQMDLLPESLGE